MIDRTSSVSSSTPKAMMNPSWIKATKGIRPRMLNVPASTTPALVMTAPVAASARSMPSSLPCRSASSRARATRKML